MADKPKPVVIPENPVDQQEVEWWTVDLNAYEGRVVQHHRALYHGNTSWKELFPDDKRGGADLVDICQLFDNNGRFTGRTYWHQLRRRLTNRDSSFTTAYGTEEEAVAVAKERPATRASSLRKHLEEVDTLLGELERGVVRRGRG